MVADGRIAVRRDLFRIIADLWMLARLLRAVRFDPMDQQVFRCSSARDTYGLSNDPRAPLDRNVLRPASLDRITFWFRCPHDHVRRPDDKLALRADLDGADASVVRIALGSLREQSHIVRPHRVHQLCLSVYVDDIYQLARGAPSSLASCWFHAGGLQQH